MNGWRPDRAHARALDRRRGMRTAMGMAALVVSALALRCEPLAAPIDACFVGDRRQPGEIELVYRTSTGEMAVLHDEERVPLVVPPQGGHILLVGVRARHLSVCRMSIDAVVRDLCTNRIIGREGRPIALARNGHDDVNLATPVAPAELDNYANVPLCPNLASARNVDEEPYRVEVRVTDGRGITLTRSALLVPVCDDAQDLALCRCQCNATYVLGQACDGSIAGNVDDNADGAHDPRGGGSPCPARSVGVDAGSDTDTGDEGE